MSVLQVMGRKRLKDLLFMPVRGVFLLWGTSEISFALKTHQTSAGVPCGLLFEDAICVINMYVDSFS